MSSSLCCSSTDAGSNQPQPQALSDGPTADKRSLRTTEIVYACFALAVGILLFATAV